MRYVIPGMLALAAFIFSPWAIAQGASIYHGVFQHDSNVFFGQPADLVPDGGVYDRQNFERLAVWLDVIWSADDGYPPEIGQQWRFEQFRLDDNGDAEVLGAMIWEVRDDPSEEYDFCLWLTVDTEEADGQPRQLFCEEEPTSAALVSSFISRCIDERAHAMRTIVISAGGSGAIQESQIPTSFLPGMPELSISPDEIEPRLPRGKSEGAETDTEVVVVVEDALGCDHPINDAEVSVSATIVEESGGHIHFEDENGPGSGRFVADEQFGETEIEDDGKMVTIFESFDDEGSYGVLYQAGDLGVKDRLTAVASRELDVPGGTATSEAAEEELLIAIEELVDFTEGMWDQPDFGEPDGQFRSAGPHPEYGFAIAYSGGCPHQPPAVWVTPEMKEKLIMMSRNYIEDFGSGGLSFNDASLQFGGFFDNKGGDGRDARCHVSHRAGIDIDVNSRDLGGTDFVERDEDGEIRRRDGEPILTGRGEELERHASQVGLKRQKSRGIHFRLMEGEE